ncbi:MAG: C25 family cysteine peptidase [Candidatus Falkowbacteria bacterium]
MKLFRDKKEQRFSSRKLIPKIIPLIFILAIIIFISFFYFYNESILASFDTDSAVISIKQGWNLIGLPADTQNQDVFNAVDNLFFSETEDTKQIKSLWMWNNSQSKWYTMIPTKLDKGAVYAQNKGFGLITQEYFKQNYQKQAIWVDSFSDFIINLPAYDKYKTDLLEVKNGWNMVTFGFGLTKSVDQIVKDYALTKDKKVISIWAWDNVNNQWAMALPFDDEEQETNYRLSKGFGKLEYIEPLQGYWLNVSDATQADKDKVNEFVIGSVCGDGQVDLDEACDIALPESFINSQCVNECKQFNCNIGFENIDEQCVLSCKKDSYCNKNCDSDPDCGVTAKVMSNYNSDTVFMVSDKDWKTVLSLVTITTWTSRINEDNEEYSQCVHPYGGADNVCVYPTLIYHQEGDNYDIDSIIHFLQQYDAKKVKLIGDFPEGLSDNLKLIKGEESGSGGAGITDNNISYYATADYFSSDSGYLNYWIDYDKVVYVEDNYETALMASTYASLINVPLIIQGTDLDKDSYFDGKNIICVGILSGKSCDESYSLEQLRQKYVDVTNTDKIILVNSNDYQNGNKLSLSAPILASAKEEVIINVKNNLENEIKNDFQTEFKKLFDIAYDYTKASYCNLTTDCASGIEKEQVDFEVYNELSFSFDMPEGKSVADISYLEFFANFYFKDCGNLEDGIKDEIIELYFNGFNIPFTMNSTDYFYYANDRVGNYGRYSLITTIPVEINYMEKDDIKDKNNIIILKKKDNLGCNNKDAFAELETYQIKLEFNNDEEYYNSQINTQLNVIGNQKEVTSLKTQEGQGITIEFNNLENRDYKLYLFFYHELTKFNPAYYRITGFKIKGKEGDKDIIDKNDIKSGNVEVLLTEQHPFHNTKYFIQYLLLPAKSDLDDNYLTIIATPDQIPHQKGSFIQAEALDQSLYSDFVGGDKNPDMFTGRIMTPTISGISAYLGRSLFYNKLPINNNAIFLASSKKSLDGAPQKLASNIYNEFKKIDYYNVIPEIYNEEVKEFNPNLWKNKHLLFYADHGSSHWAGIYYDSIPYLNNTIIINNACLTCKVDVESDNWAKDSFCIQAMEKGAIGYVGAVTESAMSIESINSNNNVFREMVNNLYLYNYNLGQAFNNAYRYNNIISFMGGNTIFLGDPTFDLQLQDNQKIKNKISF